MIFLLSLCCAFAAVVLAAYASTDYLASRWRAASQRYVHTLTSACSEMLTTIDPVVAGRTLLGVTIAGAVVGWSAGEFLWQRGILAVAGALAGYQSPALAVRLYARRRRAKIDEQFAPALLLMASGLQAGLSMHQALELAVRESPSPMADELALVVKEVRLGTRIDDALKGLPRRLPIEDVRMAVDAILTLRQTGGDLVSSFRVIAETITERRKVEGRIRVITNDGMMQGIVMCLIPPMLLVLFFLADPQSVLPIIATPLGWLALSVVGALNMLGYLLMRRMARVDV